MSVAMCLRRGAQKRREALPTRGGGVAYIETANPNTRDLNASVFSSEALSFLQTTVDELLTGLLANGEGVLQGDGREALKRDLAKTMLAGARPGERDTASLKQLVMRSRIASGREPPDY